jgi:hypothetical protein
LKKIQQIHFTTVTFVQSKTKEGCTTWNCQQNQRIRVILEHKHQSYISYQNGFSVFCLLRAVYQFFSIGWSIFPAYTTIAIISKLLLPQCSYFTSIHPLHQWQQLQLHCDCQFSLCCSHFHEVPSVTSSVLLLPLPLEETGASISHQLIFYYSHNSHSAATFKFFCIIANYAIEFRPPPPFKLLSPLACL